MRKKMMKLAALAMSAVMALSLAACGGGSGSGTSGGSGDGAQGDEADWTWERKVTLVCPWGVGGGADGTLRPVSYTHLWNIVNFIYFFMLCSSQ